MKCHLDSILKRKGLSLPALSKATGLSYQGLYQLRRNNTKRVEFATLEILCRFLRVRLGQLLELEGPE